MGAGNSSTSSGSNMNYSSQTSSPWAPQSGYLTNAWQQAQNQYNGIQGTPYTGQFAAGPTGQQYDAYGNALTQGNNAVGYANAQDYLGQSGMIAGRDISNGAASNLNRVVGQDTNANNIANAKQFAAGFDPAAQAKAAMTDAQINLEDSTIPNIYRAGAQAGGLNSSNAALMQSNAEGQFGRQEMALANQYAAQEYNQGYTNSQGNYNSQMAGYGALGSLGSNMYSAGNTAMNGGISNANTGSTMAVNAANGQQGLNQATDTANLQNYLGNYNLSNTELNNLYNIIGSKSWGGQTSGYNIGTQQSQTQQTPSTMSTIGSGLGALGSLFGTGGSGGLLGSLGGLFG